MEPEFSGSWIFFLLVFKMSKVIGIFLVDSQREAALLPELARYNPSRRCVITGWITHTSLPWHIWNAVVRAYERWPGHVGSKHSLSLLLREMSLLLDILFWKIEFLFFCCLLHVVFRPQSFSTRSKWRWCTSSQRLRSYIKIVKSNVVVLSEQLRSYVSRVSSNVDAGGEERWWECSTHDLFRSVIS